MTIKEVYPLWYQDRRINVKLSTSVRYSELYTRFIENAPLAAKDIESMKNSDLQSFSNSLFSAGLARSTCKNVMLLAKSLINFYYLMNDLPMRLFKVRYPTINMEERKEKVLYGMRERAVLTDYLLKHQKNLMHTGVLIALYTGLRIGEVCGLKWGDIDLARGTLTVRRTVERLTVEGKSTIIIQTPKTISSARTMPISDDLRRILDERRKDDDIYVVSGRLDPSTPPSMRRSYVRLCARAGVKAVKFHSLRHGFASDMIAKNIDPATVSALLGHHNVSTTLNIYTHSSASRSYLAVNMASEGLLSRC